MLQTANLPLDVFCATVYAMTTIIMPWFAHKECRLNTYTIALYVLLLSHTMARSAAFSINVFQGYQADIHGASSWALVTAYYVLAGWADVALVFIVATIFVARATSGPSWTRFVPVVAVVPLALYILSAIRCSQLLTETIIVFEVHVEIIIASTINAFVLLIAAVLAVLEMKCEGKKIIQMIRSERKLTMAPMVIASGFRLARYAASHTDALSDGATAASNIPSWMAEILMEYLVVLFLLIVGLRQCLKSAPSDNCRDEDCEPLLPTDDIEMRTPSDEGESLGVVDTKAECMNAPSPFRHVSVTSATFVLTGYTLFATE